MWIGILFEFHMVVLPWSHDSLLRILRAHVVVLVSFSTCYSVSSCPLILVLQLVHHLRLALTIDRRVSRSHEAQWGRTSGVWHAMILASRGIIKRNMDSPICVSYKK